MLYLLIICLIIIGFLGYKLFQKFQIDKSLLNEYNHQLEEVKDQVGFQKKALDAYESKLLDTTIKCNTEYQKLTQTREQLADCEAANTKAIQAYNELVNVRTKEIDEIMNTQRQKRQEDLDKTFEETKQKYDLMVQNKIEESQNQINALLEAEKTARQEIDEETNWYKENLEWWRTHYESILEPIKLYEKEKQEKFFYTIQLPEEFHEDIEFLLTTVAAKVQHPDIISKLVWSEYVKPYLDDTFKRIEIKPEPGIYKITNIDTNKAYIGKSTNVKTRIADHFKSSVGIRNIADQAVHHAILKEGFWNWAIEVIDYCDKDKLSELEKYYIDFFKTQEYGYNKNAGGGG